MVNAMQLLQGYQGNDLKNALISQQLRQSQQMAPMQMEAANLNILAKRLAMQQEEQKRNAMQQFGMSGNLNALAMADPKIALQMKMMEQRNQLAREQIAAKERMFGQRMSVAGGQGGQKAPTGYRWKADGSGLEPIPGGPGEKDKALTDTQGNATAFGMRAAESNRILQQLEEAGTRDTGVIKSAVTGAAEMVPFIGDKLGNAAGSIMNTLPLVGPNSQQQQTEQARRDFVNAVLRKESGAVISPTEFQNASMQYFPQPGDSEETIENKRRNRTMAIRALRIQAGPGAKNIPEAKNRTLKGVPEGVDPKLWEAMTPQERAAWQ